MFTLRHVCVRHKNGKCLTNKQIKYIRIDVNQNLRFFFFFFYWLDCRTSLFIHKRTILYLFGEGAGRIHFFPNEIIKLWNPIPFWFLLIYTIEKPWPFFLFLTIDTKLFTSLLRLDCSPNRKRVLFGRNL